MSSMLASLAFGLAFLAALTAYPVLPPDVCSCKSRCWKENGSVVCTCEFTSCGVELGDCIDKYMGIGTSGYWYKCVCEASDETQPICLCDSGYQDGYNNDVPWCNRESCADICCILNTEDTPEGWANRLDACDCRTACTTPPY